MLGDDVGCWETRGKGGQMERNCEPTEVRGTYTVQGVRVRRRVQGTEPFTVVLDSRRYFTSKVGTKEGEERVRGG